MDFIYVITVDWLAKMRHAQYAPTSPPTSLIFFTWYTQFSKFHTPQERFRRKGGARNRLKAQYFASVIFKPKLKEEFRIKTFMHGYTFHAISREHVLQT